jgi:ubiquinone/menaquinone biosynthesis C-methylase UbiE
MKYAAIGALGAITAAAACAMVLWLRERRRHAAFPAADAPALLNPARRFIQSPGGVVRAFGIKTGDIVLELGPGPGYFTSAAVTTAGPSGRVVAVDLQPAMLVALRDHLPAGTRVDLVAGDAMRLPLRAAEFDAALLMSMLGEVPDPARAFGDVARVLRPAGTMSLSETINDPDYVRLAWLRRACAAAGLTERDHRRQLLGYIARFTRGAEPRASERTSS